MTQFMLYSTDKFYVASLATVSLFKLTELQNALGVLCSTLSGMVWWRSLTVGQEH